MSTEYSRKMFYPTHVVEPIDFISGCLGGVAGVLVGHPFDVMKIRHQSLSGRVYGNALRTIVAVSKKESLRGFYKGLTSPLVGQATINTLLFGIQHNIMYHLPQKNYASEFLAGAIAGTVQCVISTPMEMCRIRMSQQGEGLYHGLYRCTRYYRSPVDVIIKSYKHRGLFKGVYQGCVVTAWRDIPAFSLYFVSYDYVANLCNGTNDKSRRAPWSIVIAGGIAGKVSWLSTYPLDVIKTQLQLQDGVNVRYKYLGIKHCAVILYQQYGWKVFFKGLRITMLRASPVNAATFAMEEFSRQGLIDVRTRV